MTYPSLFLGLSPVPLLREALFGLLYWQSYMFGHNQHGLDGLLDQKLCFPAQLPLHHDGLVQCPQCC